MENDRPEEPEHLRLLAESQPAETGDSPRLEDVIGALDRQLQAAASLPALSLPAGPSAGDRHIVCALGSSRFAVPVGTVIEVAEVPAWTRVPAVPEWIHGVTNLRGEVLAVVDLATLLGLESADVGPSQRARMLVARCGQEEMTAGVLVDGVQGMVRIRKEELETPEKAVAGEVARHLEGVVERDGRLLAVLDLEGLLSSPRARVLAAESWAASEIVSEVGI